MAIFIKDFIGLVQNVIKYLTNGIKLRDPIIIPLTKSQIDSKVISIEEAATSIKIVLKNLLKLREIPTLTPKYLYNVILNSKYSLKLGVGNLYSYFQLLIDENSYPNSRPIYQLLMDHDAWKWSCQITPWRHIYWSITALINSYRPYDEHLFILKYINSLVKDILIKCNDKKLKQKFQEFDHTLEIYLNQRYDYDQKYVWPDHKPIKILSHEILTNLCCNLGLTEVKIVDLKNYVQIKIDPRHTDMKNNLYSNFIYHGYIGFNDNSDKYIRYIDEFLAELEKKGIFSYEKSIKYGVHRKILKYLNKTYITGKYPVTSKQSEEEPIASTSGQSGQSEEKPVDIIESIVSYMKQHFG